MQQNILTQGEAQCMHLTSNTLSYGSLWIFCSYTGSVYSALTSLRQELDGLQHTLGVDPGLIVFHLSVNDVDHASSSAPDSSSSSVKSVHIALLESYYTFVDILKDVVLLRVREREKMTVNESGKQKMKTTQGFCC